MKAKHDWECEAKKCRADMNKKLRRSADERRKIKLSFESNLSNFWAFAKSSSGAEILVSVVKREDGVIFFQKKKLKKHLDKNF